MNKTIYAIACVLVFVVIAACAPQAPAPANPPPAVQKQSAEDLPPMPPGFALPSAPQPPVGDSPDVIESRPGAQESECASNADCVSVKDGCCPCNAGGRQIAIPKVEAKPYMQQAAARCAGQVCLQMISSHPSCSLVAKCQDGKCVLG